YNRVGREVYACHRRRAADGESLLIVSPLSDVSIDTAGDHFRPRADADADRATGKVHRTAALSRQRAVAQVAQFIPLAQGHEADHQRTGAWLGLGQVQRVGITTATQIDLDLTGDRLPGHRRSWLIGNSGVAGKGAGPVG